MGNQFTNRAYASMGLESGIYQIEGCPNTFYKNCPKTDNKNYPKNYHKTKDLCSSHYGQIDWRKEIT